MEPPETPDVDALVAELRARVEERQRDGTYPPGLEGDLAADFERVLARRGRRGVPDLSEALRSCEPDFDPTRIPLASDRPGGEVVHRAVARLVSRQIRGVFDQVGLFAEGVHRALEEFVAAFEALHAELTERVDALCERQAAQERAIVQASAPVPPRRPWYSPERLEEELRGGREQVLARHREVASRLLGAEPVLDLACGRGELLELLGELGVAARGVDRDAELVEVATGRGLPAEPGEPLPCLEQVGDSSLGALVVLRGLERLDGGELLDLVALAARKVRPGGLVLLEAINPQSLYAVAQAAHRDPGHARLVHPACLTFLFREAGFAEVAVEWRSPPEEQLEEAPDGGPAGANVARLNRLLFAPQGYLLAATR